MDERYKKVSQIPERCLRTISEGKLKGKSDINPQIKIELMTETYGMCGIGWKFEIVNKETVTFDDGRMALFMQVALYIATNDPQNKWSEPIYGYGGDFVRLKNKNGLVPNDDAYKACMTDALGNAMKYIGMAAEVYKGNYDGSKHVNRGYDDDEPKPAKPAKPAKPVYVKVENGVCFVQTSKGMVDIETLDNDKLQMINAIEEYGLAKPFIEMLLKKREEEAKNG